MKTNLKFSLKGRDWFLPYFFIYIFSITSLIVNENISKTVSMNISIFVFFNVLLYFGYSIVLPIITTVLLKIFLPKLSINEITFGFQGEIKTFLKISIKSFFLSVITLGIYMPWYIRNYFAYIVGETVYKSKKPVFIGKGIQLLKYLLVTFFILLLLMFIEVLLIAVIFNNNNFMVSFITFKLVLLSFIMNTIVLCKWLINISYDNIYIKFNAKYFDFIIILIREIFYSIITLGIYIPVAYLIILKFIFEKTNITSNNEVIGKIIFEGKIKNGFKLFWIQAILTIISLGIYYPWAFSKINAWIAMNTYYETISDDVIIKNV